jgi:hypothetical protein
MDYEGEDFVLVRTDQDGIAISASVFGCRCSCLQHWRRVGHCTNGKWLWNELEPLLWKGRHCRFPITRVAALQRRKAPRTCRERGGTKYKVNAI